MISKLDRDLSTIELSLITGQLSQPKVLKGFKKLLSDPARQKNMLEALAKADPGTENKALNELLVGAARELIKREDNANNQALVMRLAQRHRLSELKAEIGAWTSKATTAEVIIAGLKCLRELGPVDADLCLKLIGHEDNSVQREAIIALATATGAGTIELVAKNWAVLSATDRQSAIDGMLNSKEKANAFADAVLGKTFGELDGGTIEKLVVILGDAPQAKELLKLLGDSVPLVIRLSEKTADFVDSSSILSGKGGDIGFKKGKLQVSGFARKSKNLVTTKSASATGQWTHYAVTRNASGTFTVFVDGVLNTVGKKAFSGDFAAMKLGAAVKGDNARAELLEVRIWNKALTENKIRERMKVSYSSGETPSELTARVSGDTKGLTLKGVAQVVPASSAPELITAEQAAKIEGNYVKYRKIIAKKGDVENGKIMFTQSCSACHIVNNVGGKLGPDLSGAGTSTDEGLLRNILEPNAALEASYYGHNLKLKDGSFVSGFMVTEDSEKIIIRQLGADDKVIAKSKVESHSISKRSLMPEGLISGMTDQQVADLFSYLRTLK